MLSGFILLIAWWWLFFINISHNIWSLGKPIYDFEPLGFLLWPQANIFAFAGNPQQLFYSFVGSTSVSHISFMWFICYSQEYSLEREFLYHTKYSKGSYSTMCPTYLFNDSLVILMKSPSLKRKFLHHAKYFP